LDYKILRILKSNLFSEKKMDYLWFFVFILLVCDIYIKSFGRLPNLKRCGERQ